VREADSMGGKGCNVSLVLRSMGEETIATGLAGGESGARMENLLLAAGAQTDFVRTAGETRVNTVIIEEETLRHTTICAEGLQPEPEAFPMLVERMRHHAVHAEAAALCGSLPRSWPSERYGELVRALQPGRIPVVVDADGEALRHAVAAHPSAAKPNLQELERFSDRSLPTPPDVAEAARSLVLRGVDLVLASLGPGGALAVTREHAWFAPALDVPVVNPAGAGDGMVAVMAVGLARGWPVPRILASAVATASAIVTTSATADCPAALAEELRERVTVTPL
jgi:tagatose 6-phosphate kinase